MLAELDAAFAEHRTPADHLLRLIAEQVRLGWRQMVVNGGKDDPGPLVWRFPGEKAPKKSNGLAGLARALRGRG